MALKLKPGFEQKEEVAEVEEVVEEAAPEAEAEVEPAPEATANDEAAEVRRELAELKRQNAEFKERLEAKPEAPRQPTITSSELEGYTEAQREAVETQTGFKFDDVLRRVRAQERQADVVSRMTSEARTNVREAIDDAIESDPQSAKLAKHMREYLNDLPLEVKANPAALAKQMLKAKTYAKGAVGYTAPAKKATQDRKAPGPDDAPVFGKDSDEIKPGVYDDGVLKIKIEPMAKGLEAKTKHPSRKNAVQIPTDFDEEPRFR